MSQLRRCRIRHLLDKITTTDESDRLQPTSIAVVEDVLKNLRQLAEDTPIEDQIKHVDETFMDINIYHHATSVTYKCIQGVSYNQHSFNPEEFVEKLTLFLTSGQDDYTADHLNTLESHVVFDKVLPSLASYASIYGGLVKRPEQAAKEKRVLLSRDPNAPKPVKKHLVAVDDAGSDRDKKSDNILHFHRNVLNEEFKKNKGQPVDYYEFVTDTANFAATVENIFYTSFNLNSGKIQLILEDNVAKLLPLDKSARQSLSQAGAVHKHQLVTSITMAMWQTQSERIEQGILQRERERGAYPSSQPRK